MRLRSFVISLLFLSGMAALFLGLAKAQAPASTTPAKKPSYALGGFVVASQGSLAQVMRGMLFPSANVVYFAQSKNPAAVKPLEDPSIATDPLAGTFGGWAAVENSGIAIAETANLLSIPGRLCSNGRPVPIKNADWPKFVEALRVAGQNVYKAAQTKNQDKVSDAADKLGSACEDCHTKYRDVSGGIPDHCK
jgi:hypothetical protein